MEPIVVPRPDLVADHIGAGLNASAAAVHAVVQRPVSLTVIVAGSTVAWALLDGRNGEAVRLENWGLIDCPGPSTGWDRAVTFDRGLAGLRPMLVAMAAELPEGHHLAVAYRGPGELIGSLRLALRAEENISFISSTAGHFVKALGDESADVCRQLLKVSGSSHLLIATDGSVDRGHRGAGVGWVDSWGGYGLGMEDTSDILVAELGAIARALRAAPKEATRITVRSDSQAAVGICVRALRRGVLTGLNVPSKGHVHVSAIHEVGQRRDVRVKWVRGHCGDPMNEVADRLAVLARRSARARLGVYATEKMAARIVEDHML
jgi:ribonuclease HI